jgi:hypothetical protein
MADNPSTQSEQLMRRNKSELKAIKEEHERNINAMRQEHEERLRKLEGEYKERMDNAIKNFNKLSVIIGSLILAAGVLGITALLWTISKDLYSGMQEVNKSVIALQDSLLRAQDTIKSTKVDLDEAKTKGLETIRTASSKLDEAKIEGQNTLEAMKGELTAAKTARSELITAAITAVKTEGQRGVSSPQPRPRAGTR